MSALHALVLALLAPLAMAQGAATQPPVKVLGSVELTPVEALQAAQESALATLLDRFGPIWDGRVAHLVPADRVRSELMRWLRSRLDSLPNVVGRTMHEIDSTVGKVYRQELLLSLNGAPAHRLQAEGAAVVDRVNRLFRTRYAAIGALCLCLLFACHGLDRVTQGWLTLRLRSACLLLALVGSYFLYPWA